MGECPDGMSIERKNNDLGYFKGNCQWSTAKQQANNRRSSCKLEIGDISKTVAQWSEISGIGSSTIEFRLKRGWNAEKAVYTPARSTSI